MINLLITVALNLTTKQKLGEDIRAARDIFEFYNGEITEVNVNLWMKEARILQEAMKLPSLQETAILLFSKDRYPNWNYGIAN